MNKGFSLESAFYACEYRVINNQYPHSRKYSQAKAILCLYFTPVIRIFAGECVYDLIFLNMAQPQSKLQEIVSKRAGGSVLLPEGTTIRELLILATLYNDHEMVADLVDLEEFDKTILEDTKLFDVPFPLHHITLCYNAPGLLEGFRGDMEPDVKRHKNGRDMLLKMWKERFGLDVAEQIDFNRYQNCFLCAWDEDTFEDIFGEEERYFLDKGCRPLDIDLYEAVRRFQLGKAKSLLDQGASPNAKFVVEGGSFDETFWCYEYVGHELCHVASSHFCAKTHYERPLDDRDIRELIGWAAYETMYSLFEQYEKPVYM